MTDLANVIDLDALRFARTVAEQFDKKLGTEIDRARKAGCVMKYRLSEEEQIGRGVIFFAEVRLIPTAHSVKRKFSAKGHAMVQSRADYTEPDQEFDAIKAAIDAAFTLAKDEGVL